MANRIARGRFTLDGVTHALATNNGPNHLHGGVRGFDKVWWTARRLVMRSGQGVRLTYTSPDGEEGYPGTVSATVTYTVREGSKPGEAELVTEFAATTDRATPLSLAQHTYWNLGGHASGDVLGHVLRSARVQRERGGGARAGGESARMVSSPSHFASPPLRVSRARSHGHELHARGRHADPHRGDAAGQGVSLRLHVVSIYA